MTFQPLPAVPAGFDWWQLVDSLDIGIVLVNQHSQVQFWNQWMVRFSGLDAPAAQDQTIAEVFGVALPNAFNAAISRCLLTRLPVVLSNALHKFPLPLSHTKGAGERISQSIILKPLKQSDGQPLCLIQITDASTSIKREKILRNHSEMHKKDATTDSLTGLYNRRFFDAQYQIQLFQAQRQRTTLSLIMLDIDYFKNYNDHYGHPAGDSAIVAVVQCIRSKLQRQSDLAARYGGEEFIVLLPNASADAAQMVAESIRQAVDDLKLPHDTSLVAGHLTISVGVSTCLVDMPVNPASFLNQADLALYAAKQNGRNQIQYLPL